MVLLESLNLEMNMPATDFSLKRTDGKFMSLKDYAESKVLVIVFMCNHCPYVQAVWPRLVDLQSQFANSGVVFVGINANSNADYPEDSFEKMAEYANKYEMNFDYLFDENQETAKAYKAQCTPDIYVFDENRKLKYHGRIDDNWQDEAAVTKKELAEALENILLGREVEVEQKPSMGCSIKWQ